jgi:predicted transcriptional regulator
MLRTRSKHDIVADILEILREPKLKTHVMYHGNLSYAQAKFYIRLMESRRIIQRTGGDRWVITEKGRKLRSLYDEVESITLFKNPGTVSAREPMATEAIAEPVAEIQSVELM